ncbi:hypothetical protein COB21_03510 [Candidatus Aerophobetes bacterium]|uniref:LysM domain-containing protein n=1 Tax=Aerophobetes bacterium TaxID=2030807 RepID=A0A2A4X393_UNCAE|nr:MAG: hypothetical protein COB21_03510 [Candidatus Aerophobetes bacterium]
MNYKYIFFLPALTLVTSCSLLTSSPKEAQHQMELSLHKIKTDLEDFKHDLNTYEIEHHVLEGQVIDIEKISTHNKKTLSQISPARIENILSNLEAFEKHLSMLEKNQERILRDVVQLSTHANETSAALSQYKNEISALKNTLEHPNFVSTEINTPFDEQFYYYTVTSGDSLEKISKQFSVSISAIKDVNEIQTDLIKKGEMIKIPKLD